MYMDRTAVVCVESMSKRRRMAAAGSYEMSFGVSLLYQLLQRRHCRSAVRVIQNGLEEVPYERVDV